MPAETCGDPDCLICFPLRSTAGRVLTEDWLAAAADAAERGYDVGEPGLLRGDVT